MKKVSKDTRMTTCVRGTSFKWKCVGHKEKINENPPEILEENNVDNITSFGNIKNKIGGQKITKGKYMNDDMEKPDRKNKGMENKGFQECWH